MSKKVNLDNWPSTHEDFASLLPKVSGNKINGLNETQVRKASPFFWHPHDQHEFGKLATEVINIQRKSPEITEHYSRKAPRGPKIIDRSTSTLHSQYTHTTRRQDISTESDTYYEVQT